MATAKETQLTGTSGDRPSLKEMVHVTEKNYCQQGREPKKMFPRAATSPDTERGSGGASVLQETGGFQGVERPQRRTVETLWPEKSQGLCAHHKYLEQAVSSF